MRNFPLKSRLPSVTIRVSGRLSEGHLAYLDQLVSSAIECALWPLLDLSHLEELDHVALMYLVSGEGRRFRHRRLPEFHPRVDATRKTALRGLTSSHLRAALAHSSAVESPAGDLFPTRHARQLDIPASIVQNTGFIQQEL